jgi:hypothetical protein
MRLIMIVITALVGAAEPGGGQAGAVLDPGHAD